MLIALATLAGIWLLMIIWAILTFRRAPKDPPQPRVEARVTDLENRYDDLDSRVDYLAHELKSVRGRQFAFEKKTSVADDGEQEVGDRPQAERRNGPGGTSELARRMRGW